MKRYLIFLFSVFIFFSLVSPSSGEEEIQKDYPSSIIKEEPVYNESTIDKSSRSPESQERQYEYYHPYPENFMIPKGVCEKSEPVMVITK
jgi:hypothetical protein